MATSATIDHDNTDDEVEAPVERNEKMSRGRRTLRIPVGRGVLLLGAFVVVAALLVTYIATTWSKVRSADAGDDDRAAVVNLAKREFVGITSITKSTSPTTVNSLKAGVTEDFRTSVSQDIKQLQQYSRKASVSVAAAGVQAISGTRAVVLLATTGSVQTTTSKTASPISSSIKVTLQKVAGTWLVASMDLVQ